MKRILPLAALALAAPLPAQEEPQPVTPGTVIAEAPKEDWTEIATDDLMVMELAPDTAGNPRTVVIQLMPAPFSQGWVGNIRTLAKLHWWDGTSVYRVQDNWVTQWGGGAVEKEDPKGLTVVPESEYSAPYKSGMFEHKFNRGGRTAAEYDIVPVPPTTSPPTNYSDPYAPATAYAGGFPVGMTEKQVQQLNPFRLHVAPDEVWPLHCYGTIGVARSTETTGSGSELYVAIGQAPRQLDRNIAVAGRVIEGMQWLSALPRAKAANGFYDDDEADKRVQILSVRLASELSGADQPRFEYLSTESQSFARYAHVSANRSDPFYKVGAGGIDICNLRVPIRRIEPTE